MRESFGLARAERDVHLETFELELPLKVGESPIHALQPNLNVPFMMAECPGKEQKYV